MDARKGSLTKDLFPGPVWIDYNEEEAKMLDLIVAEEEILAQSGNDEEETWEDDVPEE